MRKPRVPWAKPKPKLARNIVYTLDWEGFDEDIPIFLFCGATKEILMNVFKWLYQGGNVMRGFKYRSRNKGVWLNGKSYWYQEIEMIERNDRFCSLDELKLLIESRVRAEGHHITFVKDVNKFLNM